MISFQEMDDYLYCSMLYYLRHKTNLVEEHPMRSTISLPKLAIQQALKIYNHSPEYQDQSWETLVDLVWQIWFREADIGDDVLQILRGYSDIRVQTLHGFYTGKIRKKNGGKYVEPRASRQYKNEIGKTGVVPRLETADNIALPKLGVSLGEITRLNLGRYGLGDAFADSLEMVRNMRFPISESIMGVDIEGEIDGGTQRIAVTADLLVETGQGLAAFVHDCSPFRFAPSPSWIPRRLDVIAMSGFELEDRPGEKIGQVVYRHLLSGTEITYHPRDLLRVAKSARMVAQGIEAEVYLPQFLSGDQGLCMSCDARAVCYDGKVDSWEYLGL